MTKQIAVKLPDDLVDALDRLVQGVLTLQLPSAAPSIVIPLGIHDEGYVDAVDGQRCSGA